VIEITRWEGFQPLVLPDETGIHAFVREDGLIGVAKRAGPWVAAGPPAAIT
jgi:hypothetical protein